MNALFHTEKLPTRERLPFKQVFGYLAGMVPTILMVGFFGFAYSKFFLDDLKMDLKLWYIGLAIYGVINALNDPILGYISDTTGAKKWGSRRLIYTIAGRATMFFELQLHVVDSPFDAIRSAWMEIVNASIFRKANI